MRLTIFSDAAPLMAGLGSVDCGYVGLFAAEFSLSEAVSFLLQPASRNGVHGGIASTDTMWMSF
jgi:hypothetical protein